MEFKSVSAKMPMNEITLFKTFCAKKGVFEEYFAGLSKSFHFYRGFNFRW